MAFGIKKMILGRENHYIDLLARQSQKTLEGLEALLEFTKNGTRENANLVRNIEREADELRRILVEDLEKTIATPISPEDIYALSRAIDDIVDYANTTVDEMEIYEVQGDRYIQQMVDILLNAAKELTEAVKILNKDPKVASEHAMRAKAYENTMESAYHSALSDLFKGTDTIYILKMREIYRHLSNAADRGDEAANIITGIAVRRT